MVQGAGGGGGGVSSLFAPKAAHTFPLTPLTTLYITACLSKFTVDCELLEVRDYPPWAHNEHLIYNSYGCYSVCSRNTY